MRRYILLFSKFHVIDDLGGGMRSIYCILLLRLCLQVQGHLNRFYT